MSKLSIALCILFGLICASFDAMASTPSELDAAASKAYQADDFMTAFSDWSAAATQGDAKAEYELGSLYDSGWGVPQNYALAIHWYSKAAEQGNADALHSFELAYQAGHGVPQDYIEAYKWCILASSVGGSNYMCPPQPFDKAKLTTDQINQAQKDALVWYQHHQKSLTSAASKEDTIALNKLIASAEHGDAKAQLSLGILYEFGNGVLMNSKQAVYWVTKAAKQGYTNAEWALGKMYLDEYGGIQKNVSMAIYWLSKAAEQNDSSADSLGDLYVEGDYFPQNYAQAAHWYTKAAQHGNPVGELALGLLYIRGHGVQRDTATGVTWITKAASQGLREAQANLGVLYEQGIGVSQSYPEAVQWLTKAANQDDSLAELTLGTMYYKGIGVKQDYHKTYQMYLHAAGLNAKASYLLGRYYDVGIPVSPKSSYKEKYYQMALTWYKNTTEFDDDNLDIYEEDKEEVKEYQLKSLYAIGNLLYHRANGLDLNYYEAAKYWVDAAEEGDTEAQMALGKLYAQSKWVFHDFAKSIYWYTKAAEQGDKDAPFALSNAYSTSQDISRNYYEAYKWCLIGKAESSNSMLIGCDKNKLTSYQVGEAQQQATVWFEKYQNKSSTEAPTAVSQAPSISSDMGGQPVKATNPPDVDYYLQQVLGPNGHIDKALHDKFWQQFNGQSEHDVTLGINWIKGSILVAQEYEQELWKSALLSYNNHQVIKTERLIQLEKDMPEIEKKSLPWPPGSSQYTDALASFNSSWSTSVEDAHRLLDAAANHKPFIAVNGAKRQLDVHTIEQAYSSIDASVTRLTMLLDKNWNGN